MESRRLDPNNWENRPVSSNRGFNPLVHIAKYIEDVLPGFEVGFFIKEDLEDRRIHEGYECLLKNDIESLDKWNESTAERFSIVPNGADGKLMWEENFICVRPKKWGELRRRQVAYESQVRYHAVRRGKAAEILQTLGVKGLDIGSELTESGSATPPEFYTEGEDKGDVYRNAMIEKQKAQQKMAIDLQNMPKDIPVGPPPEIARRGRGRPVGSKNKPKEEV